MRKNPYAEQIEAAKRSLESWPNWMKAASHFHGQGAIKHRSGDRHSTKPSDDAPATKENID